MTNTATKPIAIRQDPPPTARGRGQNREFCDFLRANPGEWFKATFETTTTPARRPNFTFTTRQIKGSDPVSLELYGIYNEDAAETAKDSGSEPL